MPWAGHAVSFEERQEDLTMGDRQGSAALSTEDSAVHEQTWGSCDTQNWQ